MVAEGGMGICVGLVHADRLAPRILTGTGNVLTSRLCHEKCHAGLITVTLLQGCRSSMQQMLIRARHSSYWDARYIRDVRRSDARYTALRHPGQRMSNARPGD